MSTFTFLRMTVPIQISKPNFKKYSVSVVATISCLLLLCFLCLLLREELKDKCQLQLLILLALILLVLRFCFLQFYKCWCLGDRGKTTLCHSSKPSKFQLPQSNYFLKSMANALFSFQHKKVHYRRIFNLSTVRLWLEYCQKIYWVDLTQTLFPL